MIATLARTGAPDPIRPSVVHTLPLQRSQLSPSSQHPQFCASSAPSWPQVLFSSLPPWASVEGRLTLARSPNLAASAIGRGSLGTSPLPFVSAFCSLSRWTGISVREGQNLCHCWVIASCASPATLLIWLSVPLPELAIGSQISPSSHSEFWPSSKVESPPELSLIHKSSISHQLFWNSPAPSKARPID